jgi:hypothetical protein
LIIHGGNKKIKEKKMRHEIYTTYAPETDMTFIMRDTYNEHDDLKATQVMGWYYGEPNEEDTERYYCKPIAMY